MRCGMESFAEEDVVGFSTTVPNWENAVGVRSSIGIRMDGAGIEDGILWSYTEADGWCVGWWRAVKAGEVELELGDGSSAPSHA